MGNQSCGYNLENRRIRLKMKGLQREGVWQNKRKKYSLMIRGWKRSGILLEQSLSVPVHS